VRKQRHMVTPRDEPAHGKICDALDAAVQTRRHRKVRIDRHGNSKTHSYAGDASTCPS
jgi:hypothetical protein